MALERLATAISRTAATAQRTKVRYAEVLPTTKSWSGETWTPYEYSATGSASRMRRAIPLRSSAARSVVVPCFQSPDGDPVDVVARATADLAMAVRDPDVGALGVLLPVGNDAE